MGFAASSLMAYILLYTMHTGKPINGPMEIIHINSLID